jgi:hypothetical protein
MQISGVNTRRKFLLDRRGIGEIGGKMGEREKIREKMERKVVKAREDGYFLE